MQPPGTAGKRDAQGSFTLRRPPDCWTRGTDLGRTLGSAGEGLGADPASQEVP